MVYVVQQEEEEEEEEEVERYHEGNGKINKIQSVLWTMMMRQHLAKDRVRLY
jgi:hypothetical protein